MKGSRIIAWLLVIALLMTAGSALGEGLTTEPVDGTVPEAQVDIGIDGAEALPTELPDVALAADVNEANADGQDGRWYRPDFDIDNDALFAGYVDMLFGQDDALNLKPNGYVGDRLKGKAKVIFDYLLPKIKSVASGKRASTVIAVPARKIPKFDLDKDWNTVMGVFHALLADCPYHLFWFDKVKGIRIDYNDKDGLIFYFTVAGEYARSTYETNTQKIRSAQTAVKNAKKVVKKFYGKSDYEKLVGYKQYICDAVKYNNDAIADPDHPYGNPWQLIWVFDNDPDTNIVCEGYSKAFKYLCDLSRFKGDIRVYTVTGYGGNNPYNLAGHMWNIVTMENGKNYHVDVTFCDTGTPEDFLVGAEVTKDGNYFYTANHRACYQFDDRTRDTLPKKTLKLSTKDYTPKPTAISIAQGKRATLYMGNTLALEAKLKPVGAKSKLTWISTDASVATVSANGVVTPIQAGTADIIVSTANGLSAKITVTVMDVGSVCIGEGESAILPLGGALALHAAVTPAEVITTLTWASSDPSVAIVTAEGVVQAVGPGTAFITVTTANGLAATIAVVVA